MYYIIEFCDQTIDPRGYRRVTRSSMEHDLDPLRFRLLRSGEVVTGDSGIRYRRENLPAEATRNI